jgi:hypothetical protein
MIVVRTGGHGRLRHRNKGFLAGLSIHRGEQCFR